MTDTGHNSIAADLLKSTVERIERLEGEIKELNSDKSEIYGEAKAHGLDPKIIRKIVAMRRKDFAERKEEEAILDLYLTAMGMQ